MTNGDKYLKDGVDSGDLYCDYAKWREKYNAVDDIDEFVMFMESEVKPTLTEVEKVILRNVQAQFTVISRDEHMDAGKNDLYITDYDGKGWTDFSCFNHLFQFIKPRRRI